jgi:hypothetical protein
VDGVCWWVLVHHDQKTIFSPIQISGFFSKMVLRRKNIIYLFYLFILLLFLGWFGEDSFVLCYLEETK